LSTYPITTSLKVIKPPQWVKETIKGTTPASPAFSILPTKEFMPIVQTADTTYRKLGNADITRSISSPIDYGLSINYSPVDGTFLEAMIAFATEAVLYDREDSFTFLMSQQHNNAGTLTEMYQIARGCSIESVTITVDDGKAIMIESQWSALTISDWSSSHGLTGTPTFASDIITAPWSAVTTGANPLTFNSQSYDIRHFSVTINHNPQRLHVLAPNASETATKRIDANSRDITLEMDIVFKNSNLSQDTKTFTAREMSMRLEESSNVILNFSDVFLESYDETVAADSTEAKVISYIGFASSVSIDIVPTVRAISIQKYNIVALTSLSQTSIQKYNILGLTAVSQTSIQKYNLLRNVSQTSIHKYDIQPSPVPNFANANFVPENFLVDTAGTINQNSTQKYNILANVVATSIQKYNIGITTTTISQINIQKYNLLKNIAQSSIHKYNLLMNVTPTSIQKYNLITNVIQTSIQKYDITGAAPPGPTRLYFHAATNSTSGLPTAEQSSVTADQNLEDSQTTNRQMNTTIGTAQASIADTGNTTSSGMDIYVTRFVSPALNMSSISANTWTYSFAAKSSAGQGNFPVSGSSQPVRVCCYIWRPSTSTKIGTILDGNTASTVDEASSGVERGSTTTFSGLAVSGMQAGDVIIFEVWFLGTTTDSTITFTFYYDGATVTTTDGTVSNHASFIETPEGLSFL
jgi:hypothetical protein